jgi:hypothetical protein
MVQSRVRVAIVDQSNKRPMLTFWGFFCKFTGKFLLSFYTLIGLISNVLTFYPLPNALHRTLPYIAATLFLISAYRAAWLLYQQSQGQVAASEDQLQEERLKFRVELEQAKKRPYDDAQRELVAAKIAPMTARERDLLRLLLHRGPTDSRDVLGLWTAENYDTDNLLNVLRSAGLATVKVEQTLNAARTNAIWNINPTYAVVLKDQLFPRTEPDSKPYFRF